MIDDDRNTIAVCRGCYTELVELRRMVLDELPTIADDYEGAYVAVSMKDLRPLQRFARSIRPCNR